MAYNTILHDRSSRHMNAITLDRPECLNAMTGEPRNSNCRLPIAKSVTTPMAAAS